MADSRRQSHPRCTKSHPSRSGSRLCRLLGTCPPFGHCVILADPRATGFFKRRHGWTELGNHAGRQPGRLACSALHGAEIVLRSTSPFWADFTTTTCNARTSARWPGLCHAPTSGSGQCRDPYRPARGGRPECVQSPAYSPCAPGDWGLHGHVIIAGDLAKLGLSRVENRLCIALRLVGWAERVQAGKFGPMTAGSVSGPPRSASWCQTQAGSSRGPTPDRGPTGRRI